MSLKSERKKANVSQEKLAQMCQVSSKTIYNIEKGEEPNLKTLIKIKKVLQCSMEDIIKKD